MAECYAIIAIANLCEEYGVLKQIEGRNDSDCFFARSVIFLYERYREGVKVDELVKITISLADNQNCHCVLLYDKMLHMLLLYESNIHYPAQSQAICFFKTDLPNE